MTLRGSVASFPLETIVQLLAATAKTGQLEVRSGGESGTLGFAEGRLVSAVSGDDTGDPALGAVFTISDGDFEFVPWGDPPDSNLVGDLNQLLDLAVVQRDKIVVDRQVISDDSLRFALSDRAAAQGEVRLSAEQWRALLAVNGERDLPAIATQLRIGRLATLSMLADLVRAGIIEVREAPPGPPPGEGPSGGSGGGGGVVETPSFTAAPPARDWGATRADAVSAPEIAAPVVVEPVRVTPPAPEPVAEAPDAAPEPEPAIAAAWETPPPIPPREERVWDEPQKTASDTSVAEARPWDAPAAARPWDAPAPEARPWDAPAEPAPAAPAWDAPVEQTRSWQPPAAPTETERDWGLPAQDWERSASSPADAWTTPTLAEPPAETQGAQPADTTIDERLSALSGLFGTTTAAPERSTWMPTDAPRPETFADPVAEPVAEPEPIAPPVEQPKKKGGLFGGLFKKEEKSEDVRAEPSAAAAVPMQQDGTRVARLAAFANALLDEFNNGQYGKGRLDDRIANLLMRVDEQADPIDRSLPIVADRIDVAALERANMSERQVAPYLALLVSQIYEDAEHAFGKDKAKRGFKTVQAAVIGDAASLGTDLRLPKV